MVFTSPLLFVNLGVSKHVDTKDQDFGREREGGRKSWKKEEENNNYGKSFTFIVNFSIKCYLFLLSYFTDEKTETQRDEITFTKSHP